MEISANFDVTTDYLLKTSEIADLSVKTEILEKQQQMKSERIENDGTCNSAKCINQPHPWKNKQYFFMEAGI